MHTAETKTRTRRFRGFGRQAAREVAIGAGFVFLLLSARWSLADHYVVPTGSMVPSVHIDDRVVTNKAAYGLRLPFTNLTLFEFAGPARGDVIVLDSPVDGTLLLKRVVALPNDVVEVRRGQISINGEQIEVHHTQGGLVENLGVPHAVQLTGSGGPDFGPISVPERQYLVMGDNRGNSLDGRIFGLVDREAVRGEVLGVYYREGLSWHDL